MLHFLLSNRCKYRFRNWWLTFFVQTGSDVFVDALTFGTR